jgi:hypothetical protein
MTKRTLGDETWQEAEMVMLSNLAGMAAATLHTRGLAYVQANLSSFPNKADLVESYGAIDDYDAAIGRARFISRFLWLDPVMLYWQGFQFVCICLMHPVVWEAVILVAERLYAAPDKQLTAAQINALFSNHLDMPTLRQTCFQLLGQRYPLNPGRLRQLY